MLIAFFAFTFLLVLLFLVEKGLRHFGRMEANFRGERIVQSYGLVILCWTGTLFALATLFETKSTPSLWLIAVVGYGGLGFVDDTWGTKKIKGLRGHFRAAFRERTITTGFLKAVGGAGLACFLGWRLHMNNIPMALLSAAIIALSANAINLLDLRPGRASGVFLVLALVLTCTAWQMAGILSPLWLLLAPALLVWRRDARAQVMLGDTGSNLLGAGLGLALASPPFSAEIQLIALVLLLALHILAERVSLTKLIEQQPLLRRLDRLTGVR